MKPALVLRFAIVASLLIPSTAFAQSTTTSNTRQSSGPPSPIVIGLEAGPMLSTLASHSDNGPNVFGYDTRFLGGVYMDTRPSKRVSFILEALIGNKGSTKTLFPADDVHGVYWTLEIPILARVYVSSSGPVHVYAIGGPAMDIFVKRTDYIDGHPTSQFKRGHDFVLVGGAGVELDRYRIEVRYTAGLQNITVPLSSHETDKTRTISILFGVGFKK